MANGENNGSPSSHLLSARESEIVRRAARGMIDKEIAREMHVSLNTIRTYWTRIRKKVDAVNRAEVIAKLGAWTAWEDGGQLTSREHHFATQIVSAFESAPWGYVILNASRVIVAANQACSSLFGHLPSDILGMRPEAKIDLYSSDHHHSMADILDELGTGMTALGSIRRPDHTTLLVSLTFQVMETPLGRFYGLMIRDRIQELDQLRRSIHAWGNPRPQNSDLPQAEG